VIVRHSQRATADLQAIHDYLLLRSPKAALGVLTAIYAGIEFILRHPQAAGATNIPSVRAKIVRRYRFKIFYRILEADRVIEIVHLRLTSRRPWFGEES